MANTFFTVLPKPAGLAITVGLLCASNLFMTFAWYWHIRLQKPGSEGWPLALIILAIWSVALLEYAIAMPANRLDASSGLNVARLKIIQETVALAVFVPFMMIFMGEK